MSKSIVLLLVLVFLTASYYCASLPVNAVSKTIVVPDDYASIQDAIGNATEGDTIYVKKGVYVENPVVNKSVSLVGEDRDATVIDVTAGLKAESNNVTIRGFTIYDGWRGISLSGNYCSISGNKITDATNGIVLFGCENNSITGNVFQSIGLSSAIQLNLAHRNLVSNNYVDSCVEGIQIWQSSNNNTIVENTITNCQDHAIRLQYSNNNTITRNNITNSGCGTSIYGSNKNVITNNNYGNNSVQFSANEDYYLSFGYNRSVNTINENYWSDYNGTDANGDGVGDTPYVIDENNQDNHPLMNPLAVTEVPSHSPLPSPSPSPLPTSAPPLTLFILSPANTTYTAEDIPLTFVVDTSVLGKLTAGVDYSLDGSGNRAYILGNTTLPSLPEGSHCVTVYAYDGTGNEISETVYFSVGAPEPFSVVPVAVASVAMVAVVGAGLLVYFKNRRREVEPS